MNKPIVQSSGMIVKNKEGKYLLIDRVKPPYGWAAPAGHVDPGETPKQTAIRELKEETCLWALKLTEVERGYLANECHKHRGHNWIVFEIDKWEGELDIDSREAKSWGWFSVDEMRSLRLEYAWEHWFNKLQILKK